jgi:hypothetical protein
MIIAARAPHISAVIMPCRTDELTMRASLAPKLLAIETPTTDITP